MVLGKLPGPGRPTIWIRVGQGGCLDMFTFLCFLSYFSLSVGDGPI